MTARRGFRKAETGYRPHEPEARILVVDPDPAFADRLHKALATRSADPIGLTCARDLETALRQIDENFFDVILLCLDLPDSSGLETAIVVLQQALDTAVVVIASSADDVVAWETAEYGVQNVLVRDQFRPEMVLPLLNHAIRQYDVQQTLERHVRELEITNGRFLSLVADNADAIIVVDQHGIVRFVNPSAERLLHCSAVSLLGQMFGVPLEGVENTEIDILAGGPGQKTAEIRVMKTLWDGERAFIVTMRDITERKKSERALRIAKQTAEQASAMKSQFLANMSHELRTPLNSIIGFSDMMLMGIGEPELPEKYREYVSDIHRGGTHLLSLINDLLDLSKAEANMLTLSEENFDITALAEEVVESLSPQAALRGVHISVAKAVESIWLRGDERMIRQILLNLASNAVKYTPEDGYVTVELNYRANGEVRLVVRDTGIGIPGEQIPRAFVAFVQVENAYNRTEAQGTGLGLALAKRFVELHGGTIRLESELEVGTTVTVSFPATRTVDGVGTAGDVINFDSMMQKGGVRKDNQG